MIDLRKELPKRKSIKMLNLVGLDGKPPDGDLPSVEENTDQSSKFTVDENSTKPEDIIKK